MAYGRGGVFRSRFIAPRSQRAEVVVLSKSAVTQATLAYDASALMGEYPVPPYPEGILIDQGLADKFLSTQLMPEAFEAACARVNQPLTLRRHGGYDHGYYFIQSFVADHIKHHASALHL